MTDKIKITLENGTKLIYEGDFGVLCNDLDKSGMTGWILIKDKILIPKRKILSIEKVVKE